MFTRVCYQGVTLQGESDKLSHCKFCDIRVWVVNVVLPLGVTNVVLLLCDSVVFFLCVTNVVFFLCVTNVVSSWGVMNVVLLIV